MQVVSRFFSNGKDLDIQATIRATAEASTAPFTDNEMTEAILTANPSEGWITTRHISRFMSGTYSNPMSGNDFICDELPAANAQGERVYVRHEVQADKEEQSSGVTTQSQTGPTPEFSTEQQAELNHQRNAWWDALSADDKAFWGR